MVLAGITMIVEIVVGYTTNSMALLADGWHMATHVGALGIASAAYVFARRYASHASFGFGTGKVSALAGYTSGLALAAAAIAMLVESIQRLFHRGEIDFATSIPVAIVGLIVNVVSVVLLDVRDHRADAADTHGDNEHDHQHGHHDHHAHHHDHHHDHNHRAVLLHVLADALTSTLAIAALVVGYFTGVTWLDAITGIVGSLVILHWVVSLSRSTARELLDIDPEGALQLQVRRTLERAKDTHVLDLHVWSLGGGRYGCVTTLSTSVPEEARFYRELVLSTSKTIAHVTVEVRRCEGDHTVPLRAA